MRSKTINSFRVVSAILTPGLSLILCAFAIAGNEPKDYSPYANRDFPENLYWGDTHLHTNRSADAYSFGNRLPPDVAYRYARGETVQTQGGKPVRISRPLDFLVISDHANYLSFLPLLEKRDPALLATEAGRRWSSLPADRMIATIAEEWGKLLTAPEDVYKTLPKQEGASMRQSVWQSVTEEADRHNEPGVFSAFIGFEWTSMPAGANLHRVVVFRDGADKAARTVPFSVADSRDPEDLWAYLQNYETKTGGKAMAIPHNGNLSKGQMFIDKTYTGKPLTRAYAETRSRWEPLYETTQVKGDGEAHPALSPDDLFADYETWDSIDPGAPAPIHKDDVMLRGEYARPALKEGLRLDQELGANPFKFGLIGSSDIHTSLVTVEENNFFSKMPFEEPSADRTSLERYLFATKDYAASGLAAVWARENTRESLFDSMQRRETYATTGSRISLRFFGGWQFDVLDHTRPDFAAIGYRKGVPMGGDLTAAPEGKSPRFLIVAAKDPEGANLERIQIVKGWLDANGETGEKIWDVILSDQRKPRRGGRIVPPIESTVDVKTATYTNTVGEAQLAAVWEDPDFKASERAFYYVRVLEIPTPRWTTHDAAFFDIDLPEGVPAVQQDRAYSSPIWYTP